MTLVQRIYFLSLVGAIGGLIAWSLGIWIPIVVLVDHQSIAELIDMVLIGFLVSALCIAFGEHWSDRGITVVRLALALAGGVLAGGLSGLALYGLQVIFSQERFEWWTMILAWSICGASVGFAIGVIRYGILLRRVLLSTIGGGLGAASGGALLFFFGESLPYVSHASGLILTGSGISFSSAAAMLIARRGMLRFHESKDDGVTAFFVNHQREWEICPGDFYVFGNSPGTRGRAVVIHVPDPSMEDRHAVLQKRGAEYRLEIHPRNRDPVGSPMKPLYVMRRTNGTLKALEFSDTMVLENGDLIQMGSTRFLFSLRGKPDDGAGRLAVAILIGMLFCGRPAVSQPTDTGLAGAHFSLSEKIRLLQAEKGSEQPIFRITLNFLDHEGKPMPISYFDMRDLVKRIQISDGISLLPYHLRLGTEDAPDLRRYAILLLDVSGSMLDSVDWRLKKYDVMKIASRRFAYDFSEGIDFVALVPFESHRVADNVQHAPFLDREDLLLREIENIPQPRADANTGLYSAMEEAIKRIDGLRRSMENRRGENQYLLVVMTDGKNDVGHRRDDPDLLTTWDRVKRLVDSVGVQVITVGFGNSENLDEQVLRTLAWPADQNYVHAENADDLRRAFATARSFQTQKLRITILPKLRYRSQLISPQMFEIRLALTEKDTIRGMFEWKPPTLTGQVAPSFEGVLSDEELSALEVTRRTVQPWFIRYCIVLAFFAILLCLAWFKLPGKIWGRDMTLASLRNRAFAAISRSRHR